MPEANLVSSLSVPPFSQLWAVVKIYFAEHTPETAVNMLLDTGEI
jgi:hypothetical protein